MGIKDDDKPVLIDPSFIDGPVRYAIFIARVLDGPDIPEGERFEHIDRRDFVLSNRLLRRVRYRKDTLALVFRNTLNMLVDNFIKKL